MSDTPRLPGPDVIEAMMKNARRERSLMIGRFIMSIPNLVAKLAGALLGVIRGALSARPNARRAR